MININKPKFDIRDFNGGTLSNGIKYVLVNDNSLQKSYVSVSVNTGSYANPKEYDGLAHFLEHMLFMGSSKYPQTEHYFNIISENGGYANAYTDTCDTVYFFNIYNNALEEALQIFSRFFIDPLFDSDSVKKEMNAVNSEHHMHINDDMWIKQQFILDMTKENSPLNIFGTGSIETLNKPDILDVLKNFHKKYYVANNMSICIGTSKPFTEIIDMLNKYFLEIPRNDKDNLDIINEIPKEIFKKSDVAYYLKSHSDIYEVTYVWEIDKYYKIKETKDYYIFKFVLCDDSINGLKFMLINNGYLMDIYVEIYKEGLLLINLDLTKYGMNNLNKIEGILFNYINNIINYNNYSNYAKYVQQIYNDNFKHINKIESSSLCNILSTNLLYYDIKDVYHGDINILKIKSSDEYSNSYHKIKNNNFIKIIHNQNHDNSLNLSDYKLTKMYGATYYNIPNSKIIIDNTVKFDINKIYDTNNYYLNVNPKIINNLNEKPFMVKPNYWYCGSSIFKEPYIYINYNLNNTNFFNNTRNYLLTKICCEILNFIIRTKLYKSLELSNNIIITANPTLNSINISVKCLNDIDKLKTLLNDIYDVIGDVNNINIINEKYINNLIISIKESFNNLIFINPWEYSDFVFNYLTNINEYDYIELLKELDKINVSDIKQYFVTFLNKANLIKFIYGNINKEDINKLDNGLDKYFIGNNIELPKDKTITEDHIIKHPNPKEKLNAINYYYLIDNVNINLINNNKNILSSLLTINIISQRFFNIIRTRYQLGYLVKMKLIKCKNNYYITQRVQTNKSIKYVRALIKCFNKRLIEMVNKCNFNKQIETLKNQIKDSSNNLLDEYKKHLNEILSMEYKFNRKEILLNELNNITKEDVINFINKYINKKNRKQIIICNNLSAGRSSLYQ